MYKALVFMSDFIEVGCVALFIKKTETFVFQESSNRACARTVALPLHMQCLTDFMSAVLSATFCSMKQPLINVVTTTRLGRRFTPGHLFISVFQSN
jgi:hypothetical protein